VKLKDFCRIERFWRDVGYGMLSFYRQVFSWMEDSNILDVENPYHMYALHYVYLPRINQQLQQFMSAWNHHPLSTEGNKTPAQLMVIHLPPWNYDMIMSDSSVIKKPYLLIFIVKHIVRMDD